MVGLAWWTLWAGGKFGSQHHHGTSNSAGAFVLGWTLMTIAMMLPTTSPLVLLFHRMVQGRRHPVWLVAVLVTGYLAVWIVFGILVYLANAGLHAGATRIPWFAANGWAASAGLFLLAGAYQFSSLKYACLDKCRSPMMFIAQRWRGNHPGVDAVRIGADHGIYCVGCCWSLMLLMFAVNTGSFAWMLLLGAIMAAEKNLPWGRRLSAPVGAVLIAAAVVILVVRPDSSL